MWKKILLGLASLVALLLVVVALQPATFRVVRTATIAAPPAEVFAQVNEFRAWDAWSPWAKLDPAVKNTFEGPASGAGSVFKWAGNDKVGEGRMTLTESRPEQGIRIKLEFIKPFPSSCETGFDFAPVAGGTAVTWTMSGSNGFLEKGMCLVMGGMDRMVGPDFERGLAQLKAVAESKAKAAAAGP